MDEVSNKHTPSIAALSKDEDRLVALYSPMRPKELNPEHWDRKTKFWTTAIEEVIVDKITFTMKDLQEAFTVTKRVPACLPDVIQYLRCSKDIALVQEVLDVAAKEKFRPEGWSALPGKSLRWCVEKLNVFNPLSYWRAQPSLVTTERFVHVNQLKRYSENVLSVTKLQKKLISVEKWKSEVKNVTKLDNDVDLLFMYMNESGKISLEKIGSVEILKMNSDTSKEIVKISDVEKKEYEVRRTKESLEKDLENINQREKDLDTLLRAALKEGKRMTAKHHLRSKKLLEQRGEKLLNIVDNLSSLLLQIEEANSDAIILSAYESGKKAIDTIFKENNLTPGRAIETMLDLEDVLDKHNEITEIISGSTGDDDNLEDLDAELELLLKEDQEKQPSTDHEDALKQFESLSLSDTDELKIQTKTKSKICALDNDPIAMVS